MAIRGTRKHAGPRQKGRQVDIVVPLYNEAQVLRTAHKGLIKAIALLPYDFTILYVDDGSSDETAQAVRRISRSDKRVRLLELSRNFGHQAALTAGLTRATGEIVVTMDGDGQHPPALIGEMLGLVDQGYDVVQGQRAEGRGGGTWKHWTSERFYQLLNFISGTQIRPGAADFRALSRQAVDALNGMPEYHRFLRGMISWIGFRTVILPYHEPRRLGGSSKYSMRKMLRLALDAIFSFSLAPLYLGLSLGGVLLCLAVMEIAYVLSFWVSGRTAGLAPGWSSLMFVILIVGGMLMLLLGFVGLYVGYIFQEVKRRPVYIVKNPATGAE